MAKIVITLSAVLLAVVYHSYAAPTLTFGLNGVPLPSDDIPGVSAKCNAELQIATKTCNQTAIETIAKSSIMKEVTDAMTKGDKNKLAQLQEKASCCGIWTMVECMETDAKNKCDANDYNMVHTMMEFGKQKLATELCKDYPEKTKCQ